MASCEPSGQVGTFGHVCLQFRHLSQRVCESSRFISRVIAAPTCSDTAELERHRWRAVVLGLLGHANIDK